MSKEENKRNSENKEKEKKEEERKRVEERREKLVNAFMGKSRIHDWLITNQASS